MLFTLTMESSCCPCSAETLGDTEDRSGVIDEADA